MNVLHGGCPVLKGLKYAGNVWVWNNNRLGYPKEDRKTRNKKFIKKRSSKTGSGMSKKEQTQDTISQDHPGQIFALFQSTVDGVSLYYEDTFWQELGPNLDSQVNTYVGHVWNLRKTSNNKLLRQWVIKGNPGDKVKFTYVPSPKKKGKLSKNSLNTKDKDNKDEL